MIVSKISRLLLLNKRKFNFSSPAEQNTISINYPYNYTFNQEGFKLQDSRFTGQPLMKELNVDQINHYCLVLQQFTKKFNNEMNSKDDKQISKLIHPMLTHKLKEFKNILYESNIISKIQINKQSLKENFGYLQIYGYPQEEIQAPTHYIHQFQFEREKQKLILLLKDKQEEQNQEKRLKEDLKQISKQTESKDKLLKKYLKGTQFKQTVFRIADFLTGYSNKKEKKKLKSYITIEQLKGTLNYSLSITNNSNQIHNIKCQNIPFSSKWLYHVTGNQIASIRQNRKRILFDFQHWNRGIFIPVYQFL